MYVPITKFVSTRDRQWQRILHLFADEGVPTKIESTGKVFPASDRAADVLDALLRRLARSGAQLALGEAAMNLRRAERGFDVETTRRACQARSSDSSWARINLCARS